MTLAELDEIKKNYKVLDLAVDFINPSYNISRAKHLDNSRYIVCTLTENGILRNVKADEVARIRLQKPDKTYVYNECDVLEDGRVLITLTEQILAVEGNAVCDVQLVNEQTEVIYSTKNFIINIDKTAVNNSIIASSNEFDALNKLIATNKKLNEELKANEEIRQENENERILNENERKENESDRQNAETEREKAENERKANENVRTKNEDTRKANEVVRQDQESDRQTNTAAAISNAEKATKKANDAADDLQYKLDTHHFVLTEDKDVAGGVPSLDSNKKVPVAELYEATTSSKGITQLTDSVASTSTTTAATPNSVKTANDRATAAENELESKKADLASPVFTGTPKAPTASAGTNTTQIATTAFVQTAISNGIAASDAMIIKGTIGTGGTVTALPAAYKTGWTYRVVSNGTYAGQICEIGDLVVALVDRNGSGNVDSDWCVAQTNINGAITGVKSGDAYLAVSQSGSAVTITHKDVARSDTTSAAAPAHSGTFTAIDSITSDSKGHVTKVNTKTVTLPAIYTHPTATAYTSGLYKITTNNLGHVTSANAVTKEDITALGIPASNTDTHYTTHLITGASSSATANAAATNGNVWLNVLDNTTVRNAHNIVGSGSVSVTSDASGKITISGTATTYSTGTASVAGLTKLYTTTGTATDGTMTQAAIKTALDGKANSSHTHNYAGSSSAGGSATSAVKLDSSAGSATQPVYFNGGKPTACTYTLGASVPSGAKFTDTVYTLPTASSSTLGGVKTTSTVTSSSGYTACPIISGVPYYKDTNTTYSNMTGASATPSSAGGFVCSAGKSGLVPAPSANDAFNYLRGDGTWKPPVGFRNTDYKPSDSSINSIGETFNDVYNNDAVGTYSHAEGRNTRTIGGSSHSEGYYTTSVGNYSHSEGGSDNILDSSCFTLTAANLVTKWETGGRACSVAKGVSSHSEGNNTLAAGDYSHTEGKKTLASGSGAHAEGYNTSARGDYSHAEGSGTVANSLYAHAEGYNTNALGTWSHAEGSSTTATSGASHAEGQLTKANGAYSHAGGINSTTNAYAAFAHGTGVTAENQDSFAIGRYNKAMGVYDAFVIGKGTDTASANAFRVTFTGLAYGLGAYAASGADYAEFIYEWYDGNESCEDRVGYFVTFKDKKLYKATSNDYILGITSGNPSVVGNGDGDYYWRYEKDEFNRYVMEDLKEVVYELDENTCEVKAVETGNIIKNGTFKQSENYDASKPYVERKDRKEWDYVGMLGVIPLRDDGTCIPGQFCKCNDEGIGTLAENIRDGQTFMVLERVNEHVVKVLFK